MITVENIRSGVLSAIWGRYIEGMDQNYSVDVHAPHYSTINISGTPASEAAIMKVLDPQAYAFMSNETFALIANNEVERCGEREITWRWNPFHEEITMRLALLKVGDQIFGIGDNHSLFIEAPWGFHYVCHLAATHPITKVRF